MKSRENARNKKSKVWDFVGTIISLLILATIFISISEEIRTKFFEGSNRFLFGLIFLSLLIGMLYFLWLVIRITKFIKQQKEQLYLKNTPCIHGIKGGKTLGLCNRCNIEAEKERQRYADQLKQREIKDLIKKNALELRNQEILRFTKQSLSNKEFLYNISPNGFEDVIAEMYRNLGYNVKQTPYSNDKGKDIILIKGGSKFLVECKRYEFSNTIGRESLQKFFAAIIEEKAEKGFFVTTSDFKSTAIQYAKDIQKIELINGNKLILMMREIYPQNFNSNLVKIMCTECGDVVEFTFKNNDLIKTCKNGHTVNNDFDTEVLSPKYLDHNKYCVKCGKPMKFVRWKDKEFWGCTDYPRCRSYQRYFKE